MNLRTILIALFHDRVIQAGAGASSAAGLGAVGLAKHPLDQMPMHLQPWVSLFAALGGGLASIAMCVYTCIRIKRMLANPKAPD